MANSHGTHIWFELQTTDADAAIDFYSDILGWSFGKMPGEGPAYHVATAQDGDGVAGITVNPMLDIPPAWLGYIGVDDVDATVSKLQGLGGAVHMPPTDFDDVGRISMVEDPQGVKFYVMRGSSPEDSKAYGRMAEGHVSWAELTSSDQDAALSFYADMFGWTKEGAMPMGPLGDYSFIAPSAGGEVFGAMMNRMQPDSPLRWSYYFRVSELDAAIDRVKAGGGRTHHDPQEVPGGEHVVFCTDPQGADFGLVAPRR